MNIDDVTEIISVYGKYKAQLLKIMVVGIHIQIARRIRSNGNKTYQYPLLFASLTWDINSLKPCENLRLHHSLFFCFLYFAGGMNLD